MSSAQNRDIDDFLLPLVRNQQAGQEPAVFFRCQAQEGYGLCEVSANVEAQWGYSQSACLSQATLWLDQIHPDDMSAVREQLAQLVPEQPQSCTYRFRHQDGTERWLQTHLLLVANSEESAEIRGCCQEITLNLQRHIEQQLLQSVVESSAHVLVQTHYRTGMTKALAIVGAAVGADRAYICEYRPLSTEIPENVTMSFAWSRDDTSLESMPWQQDISFSDFSAYRELLANQPFVGVTRLLPEAEQALFLRANIASTLWLPIQVDLHFEGFIGLDNCQTERQWQPELMHVLCTWTTIIGGALRHHQSEEQLVHDAFHDSLTGLPNRALFLNRLEQALQRPQRHPQYIFAVLFLDLDGFKQINDTLGHQVGDQLLVAIAKRLASCLRPGDTISRLGGDEFVVLLNDLHGMGDATVTAQRLRYQVSRPFLLGEHEILTDVSVGITLSSYGYTAAEQVLQDADQAMYEAKKAGKGRYRLFNRGDS